LTVAEKRVYYTWTQANRTVYDIIDEKNVPPKKKIKNVKNVTKNVTKIKKTFVNIE